jgi:cell division topological specificity factor
MMDIFKKLFDREKPSSAATANDRLRVVLGADRLNIPPEILEKIKVEILEVLARHFDISGAPEVNILQEGRQSAVDISIPVKGRVE